MEQKHFFAKQKMATEINRIFLFVIVALSIACLTLAFGLLSQKERIVIVPPLKTTATVGWNDASKDYMESYGLYIVTLVGNITPKNVAFVTDVLSKSTDAGVYPAIRQKLMALAEDPVFRTSNAVSFFSPEKVLWEKETDKVFVTGQMTLSSSSAQTKTIPVVYEVTVVIDGGLPLIKNIDSYEGHEMRTLRWKADHPGWETKGVK